MNNLEESSLIIILRFTAELLGYLLVDSNENEFQIFDVHYLNRVNVVLVYEAD